MSVNNQSVHGVLNSHWALLARCRGSLWGLYEGLVLSSLLHSQGRDPKYLEANYLAHSPTVGGDRGLYYAAFATS